MKQTMISMMGSRGRDLAATVASAAILLGSIGMGRADEVHYRSKPLGSTVHVDGTSNVHDWILEGHIISGHFDTPAPIDSAQADLAGVSGGKFPGAAEVQIRITTLKNGHWEGMDIAMQNAMRADTYPMIEFQLTELTPKLPHTANTPFQFDAQGKLSFNGVTNAVSMPVTIESAENSQLKIAATNVVIKMTDFQVKPPVKAAVFVTDPTVKVSFTWMVGISKKAMAK